MTTLVASDLHRDESLQDTLRKSRETRAAKHWHPTTPERESLMLALQVLNKETARNEPLI
jgi:hypothetical protein